MTVRELYQWFEANTKKPRNKKKTKPRGRSKGELSWQVALRNRLTMDKVNSEKRHSCYLGKILTQRIGF